MWDDWYGHRHPLTGKPVGDKDDWVLWDHALAQAYQTIEYYRDENGVFQWQKDDPLEDISAKKKFDPYRASVENMTKGTSKHPYKPVPGEYFVPDVRIRKGAGREMWTYSDWLENKRQELRDKMEQNPLPDISRRLPQ